MTPSPTPRPANSESAPRPKDPAPNAATPNAAATKAPATREEWEQLRRSVAMLPTGAWALKREQSLAILALLLADLRTKPADPA